jgi:hypothetical protein
MRKDDALHDGQAETRTTVMVRPLAIPLEDIGELVGRDARPVVGDGNHDLFAAIEDADLDGRAARVCERVADQVGQDLMEAIAIAEDEVRLAGEGDRQGRARDTGGGLMLQAGLLDDLVGIDRPELGE